MQTDTFGVRNMPAPSLVELDAKKSIEDLTDAELKGKKVLVRCDGECVSGCLMYDDRCLLSCAVSAC